MIESDRLLTSTMRFWLLIAAVALAFLYMVHTVLLPFVLGMATAYILDPAADRLQRAGLSRATSTVLITGVFFSLVALLSMIVVPLLVAQISDLMQAIPMYVTQLDQQFIPYLEQKFSMLSPTIIAEIKNYFMQSSGALARTAVEFFGDALTSGVAFANVISLVLITPVVAFYLLRDWDEVVRHANALIPLRHAETVHTQLRLIDRTLSGFVRGQLYVCLLLGVFYAVGLTLAGLNFGLVIGLATGFWVIFPYVGLIVGMLTGLMVAFVQFDEVSRVVVVLAVFVVGQVIEGNFVTPKLVGDRVGLHPVWIIFSMLCGATLFGFVGILLAVPVAAVLGVLVRFAVARYQQSHYFQ